MKILKLLILIVISYSVMSCNDNSQKIKTNYFDLPKDKKEQFNNVLKIEKNNLSEQSFEIVKNYAETYLLISSNPVSSGILSNYFWFVYNALPDFVDEKEKHNGYYKDQNTQSYEEKLIAYAIYRIDRSPENLKNIFEYIKPELTIFLTKEMYDELMFENEIDGMISAYDQLILIDYYKKLLTNAYNQADTATGIWYGSDDEKIFESFNDVYGLDSYFLSEIISINLGLDRYDSLYGNYYLSFWMRRNKENNMETVYEILKEIKTIYK